MEIKNTCEKTKIQKILIHTGKWEDLPRGWVNKGDGIVQEEDSQGETWEGRSFYKLIREESC